MEENQPKPIDLKPYQPFGIPIIKLMSGLVLFSLLITAIYEYFL